MTIRLALCLAIVVVLATAELIWIRSRFGLSESKGMWAGAIIAAVGLVLGLAVIALSSKANGPAPSIAIGLQLLGVCSVACTQLGHLLVSILAWARFSSVGRTLYLLAVILVAGGLVVLMLRPPGPTSRSASADSKVRALTALDSATAWR